MRNTLISLFFLSACSDARSLSPAITPPEDDRVAPVLDLRAPLRGSLQPGDAATIEVRGFVHDEGTVSLLVNGLRPRVNGDRSFTVAVPATPGITLIHTLAIDRQHNLTTDTRAVLGGPLVDATTPVADGIVARLDAHAVRAGAAALARRLDATDLGAALARHNPLAQSTLPCVGSRADLSRLAHRVARLDATPVHGGLLVDLELADLDVGLDVVYATSCQAVRRAAVGARAARFHLRGVVRLGLAGGRVTLDTADASAWLDGLTVDGAAIPGRIAETLAAALGDRLVTLLVDEVAASLPSLLLRGLDAASGGGAAELALFATRLDLDDGGATLAVSTAARAAGAVYLPRRAVRPLIDGRAGLAVGIADDAMNQLLAAAWSAGRLDRAPLAAAGAGYDAVELSPRLPPQVEALPDGRLRLIVADVDCHLVARPAGAAPRTVARLAVTLGTTLEPRVVDGRLALSARAPSLHVDRLDGGEATPRTLGAPELVAAELVRAVGELAAQLPLPASSVTMAAEAQAAEALAPAGGYLVVTGTAIP